MSQISAWWSSAEGGTNSQQQDGSSERKERETRVVRGRREQGKIMDF